MENKGFTLIELLAVIIILAIIALIAAPLIMGVINDSRKATNLSEAYMVLDGAEKLYMTSQMEKAEEDISNAIKNGDNVYQYLEMDSEIPENGTVIFDNNGNIALALYNDGICYTKDFIDTEIKLTESSGTCEINDVGPVSCSEWEELNPVLKDPSYIDNFDFATYDNMYDIYGNVIGGKYAEIISYNDESTDVVIPCQYNGVEVKSIGYGPFTSTQLTSIKIPLQLINIYSFNIGATFSNHQIPFDSDGYVRSEAGAGAAVWILDYDGRSSDIEIPSDVVGIGPSAFDSNNLKNVKIGEHVKILGAHAFYNNPDIENINIPSDLDHMGDTISAEAWVDESMDTSNFINITLTGKCVVPSEAYYPDRWLLNFGYDTPDGSGINYFNVHSDPTIECEYDTITKGAFFSA